MCHCSAATMSCPIPSSVLDSVRICCNSNQVQTKEHRLVRNQIRVIKYYPVDPVDSSDELATRTDRLLIILFHFQIGYQSYSTTGQRLSPQQQLNQQQMAFQSGTNANSNPQLSPRQPQFQGTQNSQQTQPNQPQNQQHWNQSTINSRLSVQQQNPMLNAQLQVKNSSNAPVSAAFFNEPNVTPNVINYPTATRQFVQRQRSINSPGAAGRQNSFSGPETGFPGPPSPTTQNTYGSGLFNSSQMRLQRQTSIPQGTQHLPG